MSGPVRLTLELTPEQAAALKRYMEKCSFESAMAVLYPHRPQQIRSEQAYQIVNVCALVESALADADVHNHPWIDSGQVF